MIVFGQALLVFLVCLESILHCLRHQLSNGGRERTPAAGGRCEEEAQACVCVQNKVMV